MPESDPQRRQRVLVLTLLGVGYAGYYLCRTLFSVARPQMIAERVAAGESAADATLTLGTIASWSLLASALGKFVLGPMADRIGGRRSFLAGMALVATTTVGFGLGAGPSAWLAAWCAQRFVQPLGWPGLLKIAARWTPATTFGTTLGVLSLSWLVGDAAARAFHGALLARGLSWRTVSFLAAGILLALLIVCATLIPQERGGASPSRSAPSGNALPDERSLWRRPVLWCVCVLSLTLTLVREALMEWTPTYLVEHSRLGAGAAAQCSALFPLLGAVSALVTGWWGDRLGSAGRMAMVGGGAGIAALLCLALALVPAGSAALAAVLIALLGLALIGPYAYIISNVAIQLGGEARGASLSSVIDGIGSLGAILAGRFVAELAVRLGWSGALLALAGIAALGAVAAVLGRFFTYPPGPLPQPCHPKGDPGTGEGGDRRGIPL